MTNSKLTSVLLVLTLSFSLMTSSRSAPADWGESDWYKFIEMTVTLTADKLHGGIKVPSWMRTSKPVAGRLPLLDVYNALSAGGATAKPWLDSWLKRKMEAAVLADEMDKLDVYQAYRTALNGDPRRLREIQRKAQAALDQTERDKSDQSLVLNNVLANGNVARQVEVVAQFTVGGNVDGVLDNVTAQVAVKGPTSLAKSVDLYLSQPSGYQANQFFLNLPENSPGGRYSVEVSLFDSRGVRSGVRVASFQLPALPEPQPEPKDISEPDKAPVAEADPPLESEPDAKAPQKAESLRVTVGSPSETPVGRVVTLSAEVGNGTPPYTYSWSTDGKRWSTRSVTLDYDTPGTKSIYLKVEDDRGVQGRATTTIRVTDGIAVNIAGPREVAQGKMVTFTPVVVTGPDSGFQFSWSTENQQGIGESFSATYESPGQKEVVCEAKHPSHPTYRSKAYITVLERGTDSEPLSVGIAGPSKVEQGEVVSFAPQVKGGEPPYRYSWTVKGKSVNKKAIKGKFDRPGLQIVELRVVDSGEKASEATASLRVEIADSEEMAVKILGPTRVKVGEKVSLSPDVRGGTGPYRYIWTVEGKSVEKKTIRGAFDKEGRQSVQLAVYDAKERKTEPVRVSSTIVVGGAEETPVQQSSDGSISVQGLAGKTYYILDGKKLWGTVQFTDVIRAKTPRSTLYKTVVRWEKSGKAVENGFTLERRGDSLFIHLPSPGITGPVIGSLERFEVPMGSTRVTPGDKTIHNAARVWSLILNEGPIYGL